MSDENVEKMERVHRALRFNSIFFWVGILLMATGLLLTLFDKDYSSKVDGTFILIAWVVLGGARIISVIFGGWGTLFNTEYIITVKTTYSDGTSSVRNESPFLFERIGFKLIGIFLAIVIGPLVTCIHLIIQIIKYLFWKLITKAKTTLKPSGLILIIIDLVLIVGFLGLIIYTFVFSS